MAAICLLLAVPVWAAWAPRVNITKLTTEADVPNAAIAADGAGRLHVLFGRTGQAIWYMRIESEVRTAMHYLANGVSPSIAADGLGKAHAVWSEGWEIRYKQWNGAWNSGITTISNGTGESVNPHVCTDSANNVHVVWPRGGSIWYNRRSAATGAWDGAQKIPSTDDAEGYWPPKVAAVGTAPVVAWGRHNGGNWSTWFSTKESGSWTSFELSPGSGDSSGDIDVDSSGNIAVVWDSGYDIFIRKRVSGVWGSEVRVVSNPSDSVKPRISCVSPTRADIAFGDKIYGYGDLFAVHWEGGSWSSPVSLTGGQGGGGHEIAHDPLGYQHIVFSDDWEAWYVTDRYPDTMAPPAVTAASAAAGDGQVVLSWTNPEAIDLAKSRVVWRTDRPPLHPTDSDHPPIDSNAVPGPGSFAHTSLANDVTYYYGIFACDEAPNFSPVVNAVATPHSLTCGEVKHHADSTPVNLKGKVITAIFGTDGCVYVEDPTRTSGIRVVSTGTGLAAGDYVDIAGSAGTRLISGQAAERQINATSVSKVAPPANAPVKPLAMNCLAVGGAALPPLSPGVRDAVGLNNMGLLVRISGKVTLVIGSTIYVDDGSNIPDTPGRTGVMVKLPGSPSVAVGDVVSVTGIVEGSIPAGWTANRRYIHARDWNDLARVTP